MRSHLQLMAGVAALGLLSASGVQAQIYTRRNANGVVEATNVPGSALDGYRLTYVGKGTLIHSRGFQGSYSGEFDPDIAAAAALHQLNPNLVKAVIRAESAFDQWWNEPLAIPDAAAWGGYSESQLRRLVADVTIPVAPDGHIRRRHVPVRPGPNLPLGVDPAPAGAADWAANVVKRRQLPRVV